LNEFLYDSVKRDPGLTMEVPGEPPETGLGNIIVQNTAPWTYLGDRAIHASPQASFDSGLDVLAMRTLGLGSTLRTATQMLTVRQDEADLSEGPHGKKVMLRHDLAEFAVHCANPQAFQLDGDYLGERETVRFSSVPHALRVIC
jgi:diacylglycerol kinase family enzyme